MALAASSTTERIARADLTIVGAGIVGLAHAAEARRRGLEVVVIERDHRAVGASVRNFGHAFVSGQAGAALEAALLARERWIELGTEAEFAVAQCGTLLVARAEDELTAMEEFALATDLDATVLTMDQVLARVPVSPNVVAGGLFCPLDLRIDPRTAVGAIAASLEADPGVELRFGTAASAVEPGRVHTSRGIVEAERVIVCPGPDLETLLPETFASAGVSRCKLQMMRVQRPGSAPIEPALLTGLSLLHYDGFADCPTLPAVRERVERESPALRRAGIHILVTQQPDGSLILGDTHEYVDTATPFADEDLDELVLREAAALLGAGWLEVRERWVGIYPFAPGENFLVAQPAPGVQVVSVTAGIGMTTALGLAPRVLDGLLSDHDGAATASSGDSPARHADPAVPN